MRPTNPEMNRSNPVVLAVALAAALANASCGSDDPSRVGRPPVVDAFYTAGRSINAFVGDTLQFSIQASDPDHDALRTSFAVDDRWVFDGKNWNFAVVDTGVVDVRARVTDGTHASYIDWHVKSTVAVNLAPVIETTLPIEPSPRLVIGNQMVFAVIANDPEKKPLGYAYLVNDSIVSAERQFSYRATSVGMKKVHVVITDGQNAVSHEWDLKVTTVPDGIPPAPVVITLAETGTEPGEVNVEWTAVGRDGMSGLPSLYEVRASPVPILTEQDWARGSDRPDVPAPAPAGQTMRMVVGGLQPARLTYIAVRATDDFGNISSLQPPVSAQTRGVRFGGRVIDTITGQGIPDALVTFGNETVHTVGDGTYEFIEQAARDEPGEGVGAYFDYSKPYSVHHLDVVNMYLIPNYPLETTYYPDFLTFFRVMTDVAGIPYPADQRRRDLPIGLYCRPFENGGLDYAATIREVADGFDAIVGRRVFVSVTDPLPAQRVETTYSGSLRQDRHGIIEWTLDWYPLVSLIEFRTEYTLPVIDAFKTNSRHELGHALGLNHSVDPLHLMREGPAPAVSNFSADEIAVLRTYLTIPRGWNVRRYVHD
jgi:hypothetical protein